MAATSTIPLLLSLLVGLVIGAVTGGALRQARRRDDARLTSHDEALFVLLALAAFALGCFLTYVLLGLAF